MNASRVPHTFIVRYTPPEDDILRDEELDGLGDSGEGGLVAMLFEQGIRMLHERFRRRFARALERILQEPVAMDDVESRIHDGAVIVRLTCAVGDGEVERVCGAITTAVKRTWERVANT